MTEDTNALETGTERGYSLYDLVVLAEERELDKIDNELLFKTSPHVLSVFLSRLDVDTQRDILRKFDP